MNAYAVKGPRPQRTATPADEREVAALLREAGGACVVVRGGGTQDGLGGSLARADVLCDTTGLRREITSHPEDLTVTASAGTRWADLQDALAQHGQWVPCDPPAPEQATVGGVVAGDAFGPWRCSQGSMRDLLIGLRAVAGSGRAFAAGAHVAKNVAGLDLGKLLVGSAGTLAVLTECSFKVRPLPAVRRSLLARGDALRALEAPLAPAALAAWGQRLLVALDGSAPAVEAGVAWLKQVYGEIEEAAPDAWDRVREAIRTGPLLVRATVPVAAVDAAARQLEGLGYATMTFPGLGMIWSRHSEPSDERWRRAADIARAAGGRSFCAIAPAGVADPWGTDPALLPLFRALKQRFDPAGVFAPGRFVGGI